MATVQLQDLPGFVAEGDVLGVETALAEGRSPLLVNPLDWQAPKSLPVGNGPERIGITDELVPIRAGIALLRPPSLIVAISCAESATRDDIEGLLTDTFATAGLARSSVAFLVTPSDQATTLAGMELGHPVHPTASLEPNAVVDMGMECEAMAVRAAGPTGRVLVGLRSAGNVSLSVARRLRADDDVVVDVTGGGASQHLQNSHASPKTH